MVSHIHRTEEIHYSPFRSAWSDNFGFNEDVSCVTMSSSYYEEESNMSLIVLMKNENGIVIASDSRSSLTSQNKAYAKLQKEVKKIFLGANYILAVSGINSLDGLDIEALLEKLIKENPTNYKKVIETIQWIGKPNGSYHYIIVVKEPHPLDDATHVLAIHKFEIVGCQVFSTTERRDIKYLAVGCLYFVPDDIYIDPKWTLATMKAKCIKLIQNAINMGDEFLYYNPIGGHMQMAIMENSGIPRIVDLSDNSV